MAETAEFGLVRKIEVKPDPKDGDVFAMVVTLKSSKRIALATKREALRSVFSYLTQLLYPRAADQITPRMETVVRRSEGVAPHIAYMLAAYVDPRDSNIIVIAGFTTQLMWTIKLDRDGCEDLWTSLKDNLKEI